MYYRKHIFICTNQRSAGARTSCGHDHGHALVTAFKKLIRDKGLSVDIRAQKSGCLDTCELGPGLVIYPDGVFYGKVRLEDVEEIVEEHLENGRIVERLLMDFSQLPPRT
jgi:(2Fe-2S) ferredoxin